MPRGLLDTLPLFLIVLLVTPTLASPVSAWSVREDPLKSTLASIASEGSSYITCQLIVADGGYTIQ